jgi:hypothetical protein
LGALILSYLKKNYSYANFGFLLLAIGILESIFIGIVKKDFFVLADEIDYGANYIYSVSILILGVVSAFGLIIYHQHRIIPTVFLQLAIVFAGSLILVTFSTSVSYNLRKRTAAKSDKAKFLKSEDFNKGNPKSGFSKLSSKSDSLTSR